MIDVLMGQLLTLSRLESGLSSADREDLNLSEFVELAAADSNFEAQASGKSVSFRSAGEFRIKDADPQARVEALARMSFAMRSKLPGREPMLRSSWRLIGAHRSPWRFSASGIMVPAFQKSHSRQCSNPFIELAATRKNWTVTVSVSRLRQRRFAYITP
jgi:hypothetical protein